jgi:Ca2+-binding RTX toxin-like protein
LRGKSVRGKGKSAQQPICATEPSHGSTAIRNAGVIGGDITVNLGGILTLRNSGTITGDITLQAGSNTIANVGTIQGTILGGTGDDTYDMIGGKLTGNLVDNGGYDTYHVDDPDLVIEDQGDAAGGQVIAWCDYVLGNGLTLLRLQGTAVTGIGNSIANNLTGSALGNVMDGGAGTDVVEGRNGNDTLSGGDDSDLVLGQHGNDRCGGDAGNDTVSGGAGNDTLAGDDGNDSLAGDDGDDVITGGTGADIINGGAGADVIVYRAVTDSGLTNGTRDRINGFQTTVDQIDLSAIDANITDAADTAFFFVAALTGVAGQLILRNSGDSGYLEGDIDGNAVADFSIRLVGYLSYYATDVIL